MIEKDFKQELPLSEAVFLILLSLSEGPKHGYAIMKDVYELSDQRVSLSTGTLYGALKRLLKREWVARVSGEVMQQTTFGNMIFSVPALIEYVSAICQLNPGDVIATGTPEGVGFKRTPPRFLVPGDTVEVEIERVGTLVNKVAPAPGA